MTIRLLVTGANGFLGRAFVRETSMGMDVVSISRQRNVNSGVLAIDLRDKERVRSVIREIRPTHVVNFASIGVTRDSSSMADLLAVNTIGALNVVDALIEEGIRAHMLFFGTAYEYSNSSEPLDESSRLEPQSPYAFSKTTLYFALKQYYASAPLTFLRLFNVFGAGEPAGRLIPFIVRKAMNGEDVPLTGGEQQRDFIFIDDVIAILQRLVSLPVASVTGFRTLNIGTGKATTLKAFICLVAHELERLGIEPKLKFGALPYRDEDPMSCVADNSKLINLLGNISFTELSLAVELTVRALNEH